MPFDERDDQFERALSRHLRGEAGLTACPDSETLAAYHENSLPAAEAAKWALHITACAECTEALDLLKSTEEEVADLVLERSQVWNHSTLMARNTQVSAPRAALEGLEVDHVAPPPATTALSLERKKTSPRKWLVPMGAVAAAVLAAIGIWDARSGSRMKSAVEVARNREQSEDGLRTGQSESRDNNFAYRASPESKRAQANATASPDVKKKEPVEAERTVPQVTASTRATPAPPRPAAKSGQIGNRAAQAAPPATAEQYLKAAPQSPRVDNNAPAVAGSQGAARMRSVQSASTQSNQDRNEAASDVSVSSSLQTSDPRIIVVSTLNGIWKVGDGGRIKLSVDGGKTWSDQQSGITTDLTAGSAPSASVCWVVGKLGTILRTTDGGKHWALVKSPIEGDLGGVHASTEQHATIWDVSNQVAYATEDGGATWKRVANE